MADIVALAGKSGTLTVNGVVVRLTRVTVRPKNQTLPFATSSQTLDADGNAWMNKLSGINDATIEGEGYINHAALPADRLIGNNIRFRPGMTAAGTVIVLFAAGHGFSASCLVQTIGMAYDVEGSKPDTFSVVLEVDGPLTYVNT